jgi:hypothetical protein
MTLKHVHRDDVVEVDIKGRRFRADVEDVDGSVLRIRPLSRNISYRHASARQIVRHWRLAGRPRGSDSRSGASGSIDSGPATSRV